MKLIAKIIILHCFILSSVNAATYVLPESSNTVGDLQYDTPDSGETLDDVGKRHGLGHWEMVHANSGVDSASILSPTLKLVIPTRFVLPKLHKGIVIDLKRYRLFYFPDDENVVYTYPVGIGRKGWATPSGLGRVVSKQVNPVWHPSKKLQEEAQKAGVRLPEMFPAGEDNPLGQYALRLSWPMILIHGTNQSQSIGMKVSAGCIRMLPEDIEELYHRVAVSTSVQIIEH